MNEPFDPYYTWLGIPPHEQPANCYRLLGTQLFEANQRVIDNAADRQMLLLRSFQNGPNSAESQRLLNEVSAARGWLLDPEKKALYDHQLRQLMASYAPLPHLSQPPPPPAVPSIARPPSPVVAQSLTAPTGPTSSAPNRPVPSRPVRRDEGGSLRHIVQIVIGGVAGLALAVLLLNYFVGTDILGWGARSRKQAEMKETPPIRAGNSIPTTRPSGKSRPTAPNAPRPVRAADPSLETVGSAPANRTPAAVTTGPEQPKPVANGESKSNTLFGPTQVRPDGEAKNPKSEVEAPVPMPPKATAQTKNEDEIDAALVTAKSKHAEDVESAKATLSKAIEVVLNKAAMDGKLNAVKAVLSAKEAFNSDETIPTLPELMPDVAAYIEARRIAAGILHKAYQDAVKKYTSKLLVSEASAVEAEMKGFVETERAAISGKPKTAAKPPLRTKTTRDLLADFYIRYCEGIDKIAEQDTSAKKEQVHVQVAKKLDDSIKSQSWTLRCRIRDVQTKSNGAFEIFLDPPEESPSFGEEWTYRTSVSKLKLSKEQALDTKPGDTLVLTGIPRFSFDGKDDSTVFFSRRPFAIANQAAYHAIHLTNFRFSIAKAKNDTAHEGVENRTP